MMNMTYQIAELGIAARIEKLEGRIPSRGFVRACVATIKILLVTKKRTVCAADLTLFDEQVCVMMLLLY